MTQRIVERIGSMCLKLRMNPMTTQMHSILNLRHIDPMQKGNGTVSHAG